MVYMTNPSKSNVVSAHARVHIVLDCCSSCSIALLVAHGANWVEEGTCGKRRMNMLRLGLMVHIVYTHKYDI